MSRTGRRARARLPFRTLPLSSGIRSTLSTSEHMGCFVSIYTRKKNHTVHRGYSVGVSFNGGRDSLAHLSKKVVCKEQIWRHCLPYGMFERLLQVIDGGERDSRILQHAQPMLGRVLLQPVFEQRDELIAVLDTVRVRLEPGVLGEVL
ncbi:hypothetical protein BC938DRAFT_476214 [Jimgerdemannia flammicorona]|uniref:Uncharacterized protein n=1 Tax=Jimgerdemannia flammicorona TaxID=994334 RepID=A0A433QQS1_9FUNG|nr:hypothetical protein BC938DRAFT_476214 [Jimgerdemannia flammicorona]